MEKPEQLSNLQCNTVVHLDMEDVFHALNEVVKENFQQSSTESSHVPGFPKLEENSSLEKTMHLILHAVRKGVEVIAEAGGVHHVFSKPRK
jgi:hypothetical protein